MHATVEEYANYFLYRVYGSILLPDIPLLAPRVNAHIFRVWSKHLVFDLSEVKYIDSSGFNLLHEAHRRMNESGKRVYILNPSEIVLEIMHMVGLDMNAAIIHDCSEVVQEEVLLP